MTPFDVYKTYLALKNHFTKDNYDYHKHCGKCRASLQTFYKRKDRFWFEKLSRQKNDEQIKNFFISNFVSSFDPQILWIGDIIRNGDETYQNWQKRVDSLSYFFKEDTEKIFDGNTLEEVFDCSKGHPPLLKNFLSGDISIETMVIYDRIFLYGRNFDKKLLDPVWETVSKKIKNYNMFLNIDMFKYKKILKECVL
jgi:hypothetical protein